MAEEKQSQADGGRRRSGWKILAASCLVSLALGGGAFFAVSSGALPLQSILPQVLGRGAGPAAETAAAGHRDSGYHPGAYVHLDPLVISLGPESASEHLKVSLVVEVAPGREAEVEAARPRLLDVLNVFLRAVDERDLALPASMERLRAQMLRRVQLVSPEGAVRDVLIQEFVIN